ncbi:proteasome subunit alpha type-7-1-like [Drosophila nasuta]|uniref:proteasome subunit alpha type-7-1-like n=1 Tax=Drosophila nasuta TaxID=42062 RepID=UPI00295E37AB|nr:proteasome subunit alpha type-7-1-like [Drosophila nasuta]
MSSHYDRAITTFSPDGQLLQVEYAQEAVRRGLSAVGVRGANCIVLGVEKKSGARLQEDRTVRKVCALDHHVALAFAGLTADARILINRAQIECQSHRLNVEDPVSVEYITRYLACIKQRYTQSNGRRPFGISCLIGGFDSDGSPHLFKTQPSGAYYEYKALATGRSDNIVREFFEKHYREEEIKTASDAAKMAIKGLLEVAQLSQNTLDVVIMEKDKPQQLLEQSVIHEYISIIEKEKEAELEKKKQKK